MPAPGFYARVNQLIEKQQPAPFWAAVLEPLFGKRLALASLLALATFGTVLVSREMEYTVSPEPRNGAGLWRRTLRRLIRLPV